MSYYNTLIVFLCNFHVFVVLIPIFWSDNFLSVILKMRMCLLLYIDFFSLISFLIFVGLIPTFLLLHSPVFFIFQFLRLYCCNYTLIFFSSSQYILLDCVHSNIFISDVSVDFLFVCFMKMFYYYKLIFFLDQFFQLHYYLPTLWSLYPSVFYLLYEVFLLLYIDLFLRSVSSSLFSLARHFSLCNFSKWSCYLSLFSA